MNQTCRQFYYHEYQALLASFHGRTELRNRMLVIIGCNTGFRISELLSVKRGDLIDDAGNLCDALTVSKSRMKKKRQSRTVKLNYNAKMAIRTILEQQEAEGLIARHLPLFASSKDPTRPISRTQAWEIIHRYARKIGLVGTIGTHSMRKTFGSWAHTKCTARQAAGEIIDPMLVTSLLMGHKSVDVTAKYLGLHKDQQDAVIDEIGNG